MKSITQTFSTAFGHAGRNKFHITARNFNCHLLSINAIDYDISVKEMRQMAEFLNSVADKIEADREFSKIK